jgi:ABC-2 type transport system permease protein
MTRVFAYLAWCSARNRLARQLRQLRSPRYLAALAFGLGYLWLVLVQQRPAPTAPRGAETVWIELIGALAVAAAVAWGWLFGVERRVLAFSPAEVTFLFSGPVTRTGLVQYKLLRNQLFILFNSLLWTLILARERFGVSPWLRAISIWVLLTTLSFHRLGASFVRTSLLEHGRFALRHRVMSLVVVGGVLIAFTWSIRDALPALSEGWSDGIPSFLAAIAGASRRPLLGTLLRPFEIMIRPLTAPTPTAWLHAVAPAVVLLVLHYVWVIRADTAFEEAAAETSLERARHLAARRSGESLLPRLAHRRLPPFLRLRPLGWPAGAILWKNVLAVVRTRRVRTIATGLAVTSVLVALLSFTSRGGVAELAGWLAATWAGLMVVIGPQWVRNDLRGDLLKLDLLRSYPLRGAAVVTAEVAASTLVLTAAQLALLLVAYLALLGNTGAEPGMQVRSMILGGALIYLPAVNFMGLLIHNGAAILFPAWVHLGSGRPSGVEVLGQNMLMVVAYLAVLALALSVPAALGGGLYLLLGRSVGLWAIVPGSAVLLALLGGEAVLLVHWLGGVFERTDPASAGIVT